VDALVARILPSASLGWRARGIRATASGWTIEGEGGDALGARAVIVAVPALRNAATRFAQDAPDRVKGVLIADCPTADVAELRSAVERSFS